MIPIFELSSGDEDAPMLARECARRVGLPSADCDELAELVASRAGDSLLSFGLDAGAFVMCIDGRTEVRREVDDAKFDAQGLTELRLELVASHARAALGELKRQNAELLDALAQKELAEELHRVSERRLELAAEAAGLGTWEVNGDVRLSPRAAELLGLESPVGLADLGESLQEGGRRLVEAVRELEVRDEVELDVRTDDRWLQLRGAKIGNPPRVVGTVLDITERKEREQEVRFRLDVERQLVGIVSHDLKSPLAAIAMGIGMLDDADAFVVERMRSSVKRAQQLIFDLLDFTRARLGGGIPVETRLMDLVPLVRECLEQSRLTHGEREILYVGPDSVRGSVDPARVAQVVTNLLANAIEYGDPKRPIRVSCEQSEVWASISVHNHGDPIPADRLETIFEPLERAQPGERGSLGLGLFIVDAIVQAHDGDIDVQSSSAGTEFTVRFRAS